MAKKTKYQMEGRREEVEEQIAILAQVQRDLERELRELMVELIKR